MMKVKIIWSLEEGLYLVSRDLLWYFRSKVPKNKVWNLSFCVSPVLRLITDVPENYVREEAFWDPG